MSDTTVNNVIALLSSEDEHNKELAFLLLSNNPSLIQHEAISLVLVWYKSYALYHPLIKPLLKHLKPKQIIAIEQGLYIFNMQRFVSRIDVIAITQQFEKYEPFHESFYQAMRVNPDYIYYATSVIDLLIQQKYQLNFAYQWYQKLYEDNRLPLKNQINYACFMYDHIMPMYSVEHDVDIQTCLSIIKQTLPIASSREKRDLHLLKATIYCTPLKDASIAIENFEKGLEGNPSSIKFDEAAWLLYHHHTDQWEKAYYYAQRATSGVYFRIKAYYVLALLTLYYKKDQTKAIEIFRLISKNHPDRDDITTILKNLEEKK